MLQMAANQAQLQTGKLRKIRYNKKRKGNPSQKKTTKDVVFFFESALVHHVSHRKNRQKLNNKKNSPQQQKRKTVVVAGDSIIKYVKGWELSNTEQNVAVSFSGATREDMNDFLRPTTRRPPDWSYTWAQIHEARCRRILLTKLLKWHTSSNTNRRKQE